MEAGKSPFQPHGTYVTPLLISMAGVAATSLVIMAYHLILVRFCMRDRANAAAAGQPVREEPVGVDVDLLNTIPVFAFTSKTDARSQADRTECVVCLAELEEGEMVRSLPNCHHLFHVECIDDWFSAHSNCPLCRSEIAAEPEPEQKQQNEDDVVGESEQSSPLIRCPESQGGADQNSVADSGVSTSDVRPNVLLRHCVSLVLSREGRKRRLVMGLKRSLSMDHSYILVNLHGESEHWKGSGSSSSSSSSAAKRGPYGVRSVRQLDRMSSRWLRSFWQLRLNGRRCNTVDGILPY